MIASGQYLGGTHEDLVPGSDGAGEVVAVGEDVRKWKVGDRVSANFALDHVSGETNRDIQQTALGGLVDGVLTEYQVFPDYVRGPSSCEKHIHVEGFCGLSSLSFEFRTI